MGCFLCSGDSSTKRSKKNRNNKKQDDQAKPSLDTLKVGPYNDVKKENTEDVNQSPIVSELDEKSQSSREREANHSTARRFSFAELEAATENFKPANFLGEGGFGKVYKGKLNECNQIVAIKQLDRNGMQGFREFIVEMATLSMADHPNLVKLIGYCDEGRQMLLVYEYMPLGSLEDHLHDPPPNRKQLDWNTRMKIAAGAARGLEYLHTKMNPPMIYRDLKCSNILLGEEYHAKLSDFGFAKVGPLGDNTHVSTRVMGTYGYCAPDYAMTGQLTFKSDIYSFGVVLLELITGRKAIDLTRPNAEKNLVGWARPLFKDRRKFSQMADPVLQGQYPVKGLYQALAIAAMCVQEQPNMRPSVGDLVTALNFLASQDHDTVQSSRRASRRPTTNKDQKPIAGIELETERTKVEASGNQLERERTKVDSWSCEA